MGTGGGADSDDDPMGRIPQPSKTKEVLIKSGQFLEEKKDLSTSYDPPVEDVSIQIDEKQLKEDEEKTMRMLRRLEGEMTKGRHGGKPSDPLDMAMYEITQVASNMIKGRRDLLQEADKVVPGKVE